MFDLGWTELLVIGVVALIVVGPKDLPQLFRAVGRFTGKARSMAREFSSAMNAAADEAGMKDIQKTINAAADPAKAAGQSLRQATSDITRSASARGPERKAQADKTPAQSAGGAEDPLDRAAGVAAAAADAPGKAPADPPKDRPA
ncbi:MAG: sec-independent protein translocase protein TatB [Rhodobacteraceae bacterium HLUCCA08]|nr:MAG: sec-independent protein translocase protein TatB [Rhodobacteraceae bacterium HLUCCA08]